MPDWYSTIIAAKYLGVPAWELVHQPLFWQEAALLARQAENEAGELLRKTRQ